MICLNLVLSKNKIPLTVCPLSNIKLRVFDNLKDHSLKKMLDKKLIAMVNSDDPAYFGGYLNQNLIETQEALNLTIDDIKTLFYFLTIMIILQYTLGIIILKLYVPEMKDAYLAVTLTS